MREIKFKLWNPAGKSFLFDVENVYECLKQQLVHNNAQPTRGFTAPYDHDADGTVWLQFTGLKDKNGKEIYEGDILEGKYPDKMENGGFGIDRIEVAFQDGAFGWIGSTTKRFFSFADWPVGNYEVIGNIYQHPLLLKGGVT